MKYFTLKELTHTDTGIENIPNEEQILNLEALVDEVLDPARELLQSPIKVDSGFRCPAVNIAVGGKKTSQHLKGEATDLKCFNNKKLFELIRDNLVFDQVINEYNFSWVHVSYSRIKNRNQVLVIT
jgi:zinc D-Ala-D-Ala carboxypeptidase